jgi:hypothetical protein
VAWQRPTAPAPGLGSANDDPLSWPPDLGAAEDGARHGTAGDGGAVGDGGAMGDSGGDAPEWCAWQRHDRVGHADATMKTLRLKRVGNFCHSVLSRE